MHTDAHHVVLLCILKPLPHRIFDGYPSRLDDTELRFSDQAPLIDIDVTPAEIEKLSEDD